MSLRAFEIQTYQRGRWKIDSVFDDRELALFEAKRMDASGRFSGVRVVEEDLDQRHSRIRARTIFRGTKTQAANDQHLKSRAQIRKKAQLERRRRTYQDAQKRLSRQRKMRKKQANPYRLAAIMIVLVIAGLAALYGLHYLQRTM